jgi:large subunit ribosomal protein L9
MSQMFERDNAGFTEAYDPNAEPGTIAEAGNDEATQADQA